MTLLDLLDKLYLTEMHHILEAHVRELTHSTRVKTDSLSIKFDNNKHTHTHTHTHTQYVTGRKLNHG